MPGLPYTSHQQCSAARPDFAMLEGSTLPILLDAVLTLRQVVHAHKSLLADGSMLNFSAGWLDQREVLAGTLLVPFKASGAQLLAVRSAPPQLMPGRRSRCLQCVAFNCGPAWTCSDRSVGIQPCAGVIRRAGWSLLHVLASNSLLTYRIEFPICVCIVWELEIIVLHMSLVRS